MHVNSAKTRMIPLVCLLFIYLPGVVSTGLWLDDYPTVTSPESHQIHASRDGRPLYGFALQFIFGLVNGAQYLWIIRLLALIGLLLLTDLVIQILNPKRDNLRITLSTIGAFSIVSFQLSIHWASAFLFPWVAYFALLGLIYLKKNSWLEKSLGFVLLTVAALSYPILVFFIIPLVFLSWFESEFDNSQLIKNLLWSFLGISISAVLSIITNHFLLGMRKLSFNDRVEIVSLSELPEQLIWFLSRPFVLTFRGYSIDSPTFFNVLIGLLGVNSLILLALYLKHRSITQSIFTYLLLLGFDLLSLVPILLPNQQQIEMRYVTVGAWLISYMLVSSIYLITSTFTITNLPFRKYLVATCMFVVFFLSINFRYFSIIRPIYTETSSFISKELSLCSESQIQNGVHVLARTSDWPNRKYIGMFSQITDLASPWVPLSAVKIELEKIPGIKNREPRVSWGERNIQNCTVDLNAYQFPKE